MLELLLQDKRVNARSCLFLLRKGQDKLPTHCITLKQFIQAVKSPNMDQLLTLLNRESKNSYINSARLFLSKFTTFKQTKSVLDKETSGYTQVRLNKDSSNYDWWCGVAICGDIKADIDATIKIY